MTGAIVVCVLLDIHIYCTPHCNVYADHAMPNVPDVPWDTVYFDDLGRDDSRDRAFSGDSRAPVTSLRRPHRIKYLKYARVVGRL